MSVRAQKRVATAAAECIVIKGLLGGREKSETCMAKAFLSIFQMNSYPVAILFFGELTIERILSEQLLFSKRKKRY